MMKYVGLYWTLFAPMMKKSIAKRFDKELADRAIRQGKVEYKGLLARADDLGPGNPMAITPILPMSSRRRGWAAERGSRRMKWRW